MLVAALLTDVWKTLGNLPLSICVAFFSGITWITVGMRHKDVIRWKTLIQPLEELTEE